ncbi:MAG: ADP-glyceromanno-heptose 6-epimerase [Planctomycetota bacterium]|jgi:ADP-L-glycero-D-manno-heptose 6-epimerase|nr:ADP-glyceromanno-heptose 6-epimerase [Planctomycetota bacterium]
MYIVTGGAGFIGSVLVWKLNRMGIGDVWIVDSLRRGDKWRNLAGLAFAELIQPGEFLETIRREGGLPAGAEALVHLGACSSTVEADADYLLENNFRYSRTVAEAALARGTRLIVASSAAVYGGGERGYGDGAGNLGSLRPLNMYGYSKLLFDRWAVASGSERRLASLRFFNVYGPNEYHKGDMASMVFRSYRGVAGGGPMTLFRSHRPDFADGEQKRDFVYVKDVVEVIWWLLENPGANGIMNVGSGEEETWNQLGRALFAAVGREPDLRYADMPANIRDRYQYRTRADIRRLRAAGCPVNFRPLAEGVRDYVANHLSRSNPWVDNDPARSEGPT